MDRGRTPAQPSMRQPSPQRASAGSAAGGPARWHPRTRDCRRSESRPRRCAAPAAGARCDRRRAARAPGSGRRRIARGARRGRSAPHRPPPPARCQSARARARLPGGRRAHAARGPADRRAAPGRDAPEPSELHLATGASTRAPRFAYSSGRIQAYAMASTSIGTIAWSAATSASASSGIGSTWAMMVSVQSRSVRRSVARLTGRRHRTPATSGSTSALIAVCYPPAIGRRRITSGSSTGSSRTASPRPSPRETTAR